MKSERRHELHTNALADWLAGIIERIRPYQTTSGRRALGGAAGRGLVLVINRSPGKRPHPGKS